MFLSLLEYKEYSGAFLDDLAFVVGYVQGIKVNVGAAFIGLAVCTRYILIKPFLFIGASSVSS